jgi:hypothetical protein
VVAASSPPLVPNEEEWKDQYVQIAIKKTLSRHFILFMLVSPASCPSYLFLSSFSPSGILQKLGLDPTTTPNEALSCLLTLQS